ncbi:dTDP-4-dehydrorhamnose 3,5-epimerase [Aeromonas salmonicida]|uniref:dTDP-4-dehydrorhamnose 3,5-epimerase n=1 Tax=Aeromonas salmonicida TaxID=645 RepID=UPI00223E8F02|nr:dTDP-4-dehydrorhamnose 3,5-epimerase [Aeromonas salmonicida]MDF8327478.1 dTDP-4-dehydrorhamnose 3,5-epimerase [Aeromonas salmonicida]
MQYRTTDLADVIILTPRIYRDKRGEFMECFRQSEFELYCGEHKFVQDNLSRSFGGTLRGLHYQQRYPQGKLVQVMTGTIFDVAVDIRVGSPTYGTWVGHILSADQGELMWIPPGFAHGFYVMSEMADVFYKCTDYYQPDDEHCIRWDSSLLAINWPLSDKYPLFLSDKDSQAADLVIMV